ncbi:hypothetical protein F1721_26430 [Saccharopolyspora hirsuta]|uniref:Uncharacterized protein n=1 Tax=Saccharopolyspora hirsuta TaxID=1837 RepID=A0A5M7BS60_SACHI|nr:hypothetical protein [Saccharopolyspora hirsuta]KAA5829205.1 hypothetical protein F1721_26430 [Saccharopolyspora hirsuta]
MIIVLVSSLAAVVAFAGWLSVRQFAEQGKHAGAGVGALTVQQLLAQIDAEDARWQASVARAGDEGRSARRLGDAAAAAR